MRLTYLKFHAKNHVLWTQTSTEAEIEEVPREELGLVARHIPAPQVTLSTHLEPIDSEGTLSDGPNRPSPTRIIIKGMFH